MVFDMAKVKTYEFWFTMNKMYASKTIKRAYWLSKPVLLHKRKEISIRKKLALWLLKYS